MEISTTIKQDGKFVSLCYMNGERFDELCDAITTVEDAIKLHDMIEQSVREVENNCNDNIARARRAISNLENIDGTDAIIATNELAIEKNQKTIDALNPPETEFCWWKFMQQKVALMIGDL